MTESDGDDEYCAKCGDSEYDEDGNETHADEEEYDHDFEYEEEPTTLEDVKEFADTVKSLAEAGKAVKEVLQPSKIDPSQLRSDRFKNPPPKISNFEMPEINIIPSPEAKAEKRHRENIKLTKISIVIGAVVAIILGTLAIILN